MSLGQTRPHTCTNWQLPLGQTRPHTHTYCAIEIYTPTDVSRPHTRTYGQMPLGQTRPHTRTYCATKIITCKIMHLLSHFVIYNYIYIYGNPNRSPQPSLASCWYLPRSRIYHMPGYIFIQQFCYTYICCYTPLGPNLATHSLILCTKNHHMPFHLCSAFTDPNI